jgi:hypothetical protein
MEEKITVEFTKSNLMKTIASLYLSLASRSVKDKETMELITNLSVIAMENISDEEMKKIQDSIR